MNKQKIIQQIDILRAIRSEPTTVADITATCSPSRSTIRRFVCDAQEWSLIQQVEHGYMLTAAGNLLLREYDDLDEKTRVGLSVLTEREYGLDLLRIIGNQPPDKAAIVRMSDASRATVQRSMDSFRDYDWFNDQTSHISLKPKGKKIIEAYDTLGNKIDIIADKIEFLERFENDDMDIEIPLEALAESRQVVSTVTDSQKVVRKINEIDTAGTEPQRALSPAFSAEISDEYYSRPSEEVKGEIIVDRSVYKIITHPRQWKYLFQGLRHENLRILVHPDNVTIGVAYCGNKEAVISAYNAEHPFHVGLFGENDALIEWTKKVYEYHRAQANPPGTDLVRWAMFE